MLIALRGYFSFTLTLVGELAGLNRRVANTDPSKSSASLNLPPDRKRDPLRRSGEKLSGLCLWVSSLVEPFVASDGFDEDGDRCLWCLKAPLMDQEDP